MIILTILILRFLFKPIYVTPEQLMVLLMPMNND